MAKEDKRKGPRDQGRHPFFRGLLSETFNAMPLELNSTFYFFHLEYWADPLLPPSFILKRSSEAFKLKSLKYRTVQQVQPGTCSQITLSKPTLTQPSVWNWDYVLCCCLTGFSFTQCAFLCIQIYSVNINKPFSDTAVSPKFTKARAN